MMMMNFAAITTEIGIVILMLVTLVMDLLLGRGKSRAPVAYVTAIGLCALLVYTFGLYHGARSLTFFAQLFIVDNYAIFFKQVFIVEKMHPLSRRILHVAALGAPRHVHARLGE